MRIMFWRNPYDLDSALACMAAADASCAEYGHDWQPARDPYKGITEVCLRCGDRIAPNPYGRNGS